MDGLEYNKGVIGQVILKLVKCATGVQFQNYKHSVIIFSPELYNLIISNLTNLQKSRLLVS